MKDFIFISTTNTLVIKGGKGLFIKRDESLEDFPGWLMLPGGKQEYDETPQQSAVRETFEETGLKIADPELKVIATHNHYYKNKVYLVYIFTAKEFSGKLIDVEEDKGTPVWIPLDEALGHPKLYPDLKRHIKLIRESENSDVIFTYHKFNKNLEIIKTI
jgi:8-oxo-dGTP diphosphatase